MSLDRLYQKLILQHNQNPHHFRAMPEATHVGRAQDALCGDDLEVALLVAGDKIECATFHGEACAVTKASASMLTQWLQERSVAEVLPAYRDFQALLADPNHPKVAVLGLMNELQPVGEFAARRGNACLPWIATLRALDLEI